MQMQRSKPWENCCITWTNVVCYETHEPQLEKTNVLHMQKQRCRSAVTAKLISAFVFATWIVQYLYFLNTKFQASSNLQLLKLLGCVRPGQNPYCWFCHVVAHISCITRENVWGFIPGPSQNGLYCHRS